MNSNRRDLLLKHINLGEMDENGIHDKIPNDEVRFEAFLLTYFFNFYSILIIKFSNINFISALFHFSEVIKM